MPNGRISAKCNCGATVGVCNCLSHESRPHPFKEWSGGGPVRPYCGSCGRLRNDPLHATGVPVEPQPDGVNTPAEIDRDTDGELLIDWSPGPGRMVTLSLRSDGRLSYAITWDGEQSHGTAQMPAGVEGPEHG